MKATRFNFSRHVRWGVTFTLMIVLLVGMMSGCTSGNEVKTEEQKTTTAGENTDEKGSKGEAVKETEEDIELTFYYPVQVGGPLTKIIEGYVADFEAENPSITVKPVYAGSYSDTMVKTQTSIQGGESPDVAVLDGSEIHTLLDMNAIVPIDELLAKDGGEDYINDFYAGFLGNSVKQSKLWNIPFQRSTQVMFYNKDAFKAAGLDPEQPPKTWEEVIEYGKKLTIKDDDGMVSQWGFQMPSTAGPPISWIFQGLAYQNMAAGVDYHSEDGKAVYFNTPENVEALQYWVDLVYEHKIMPEGILNWKTVPANFLEGKVAMFSHTTGNLTSIKENAGFEYGVAFLPGSKQYGTPLGGGNLFVFKDIPEENKEAAWKFIRFITQPEYVADWSIKTGYIATRKSAYDTEEMKKYVEENPGALVARDQMEFARPHLSVHSNQNILAIIGNALQAAVIGDMTPQEALDLAQKESDKVLETYK